MTFDALLGVFTAFCFGLGSCFCGGGGASPTHSRRESAAVLDRRQRRESIARSEFPSSSPTASFTQNWCTIRLSKSN